ncbi:MAG TPA: prolyl oligopeptidase family serine peptidase, partial [Chitinophagaceae bacterium]|nr:prolyl oligopeptidase family serine peptidase [Chitinophagaceae bacterium]
GDKLLLLQQELIAKALGSSETDIKKTLQTNARIFETVVTSSDSLKLRSDLKNLLIDALRNDTTAKIPDGMTKEEFVSIQVNQISTPWMQYFLKYDPAATLEKVKCPVLAVNGEKDLQVPPKENLNAIKMALKKGGNKNVTTIEFPNLNHLFQEAKTGSPTEYATIEQTISPVVLAKITKWVKEQTK